METDFDPTTRYNNRMKCPSTMATSPMPHTNNVVGMGSITIGDNETRQDKSKKSYSWCFTAFDLTELSLLQDAPGISVLVVALEICPKTGREHHQGYVRFSHQMRLSGLKRLMPTAHFEPRIGEEWRAVAYIVDVDKYNALHPNKPPKEQGEILINRGKPAVSVNGDLRPLERAADMIERGGPLWEVHKAIGSYAYLMNAARLKTYHDHVTEWRENKVDYFSKR